MKSRVLKSFLFVFLFLSVSFNTSFAEEIKILSLNSWTMPVVAKKIWDRTKIIGSNIHGYDFIGLQEIWLPWHRSWIRKYGPKGYTNIFQRKPFFKLGLGSGLFNLTRYKIVKSGFVQFSDCDGVDCLAAKGVLFVRVEMPSGIHIDIFNTHLQAGWEKADSRHKQLMQLSDYINFHDRGNPTVVMGDFNVVHASEEFKNVGVAMNGFIDIWAKTHPYEPGYTSDSNRNPWVNPRDPSRIDYIFIRDGINYKWKINQVNLAFDQPLSAKGSKKQMIASDHFGVAASLELLSKFELAVK